MAEFSRLVTTEKGNALIAKAFANTANIKFTKVSSSATVYEFDGLEALESLTDIRQTYLEPKTKVINKTSVEVKAAINNIGLENGYYIRAFGLYANDPDEGEILYGVAIETSGNCYMPAHNGVTSSGIHLRIVAPVGNSEKVPQEIYPAAVATLGDIEELREELETPDWDDSGEVEGITSFTDFMESFVKGTSIYQFLANFKAGMKFLLHCGQLVNNGYCETPGKFPMDAAFGKTLQDQITGLYSEIVDGVLTYNPNTGYFGMQYAGAWNDILFAGLEAYWLYNKGNEFTARTGGWSDSKNITGNKMTKYNDHINLLAVPGNSSSIAMGNATLIDFSNFDRLYIDMECISENPYLTYFVTLFSQEGVTINLKVSNDGPISRRIIAYDIAQYNSKYIIYIQARNTWNIEKNCNVNVYSVRLA